MGQLIAFRGLQGVGAGILQSHLDLGYFPQVPSHHRRVIWNPAVVEGIGSDYVKPSMEGKPLTFGYLGRINIEKGVGVMLDAFRMLPEQGWRLIVAGKEPSESESLKPRAAGMPVDFVGFVQPKDLFDQIDVLIDVTGHTVKRNGEPLSLTPLEFDLLVCLARKPWQVFSREVLLEQVWGYRHAADTRLVNVHVQRLRSKVEHDPENPEIVVTVRGVGYRAGTA